MFSVRCMGRVQYPYTVINVVLLHSEKVDLGVTVSQISPLGKLWQEDYRHSVSVFQMPSTDSREALCARLRSLIDTSGKSDRKDLATVYYCGHGGFKRGYMRLAA